MRYIIYFTDQTNIEVDEAVVEKITDNLTPKYDTDGKIYEVPAWVTVQGHLIRLSHITHISSVESLANPHSGVITPKTPQELKDLAERERQKIISSPDRLTQRIRQKGEDEGGQTTL